MKNKNQSDKSKIKKSLEYSNSIIATLREPFLVLDKELKVISTNHAFYATFKVTEKETLGQFLPDLGDRQWNIPNLLKLLKEIIPEEKIIKDYEVEHKFEQIGEKTMLLNACQLRVPKKITALIAVGVTEEEEEEEEEEELILLAIEDVTEDRRQQEELKNSEERFRRAFETARDGLLLVDKTKGTILNSSESAQELLGYSQKELLKMKLWEIGVTKGDKDFQEMVLNLERDGLVRLSEGFVKTKKNLSMQSDIFLIDKAKVVQCNIRDITERKKAEEVLRSSEERFRVIFDNANDGMLLADTVKKNFYMANHAICQMLGYSLEEIKNLSVSEIHPQKDLPYVVGEFERQVKKEIAVAKDIPMKRKDGSVFYADVNSSPITLAGKTYLLGIFRDITVIKKAQEEKDKLLHNINERVKELNCLYGLSKLTDKSDSSLEEIFQQIVELISLSWECPNNTCVRIIFEEKEFKTGNFKTTQWKRSVDIKVHGEKSGTLEVYVFEEKPKSDERQFLEEEKNLIAALGSHLGRIAERIMGEEALKKKVDDLEKFHKATVGRELKMIDLKKEINELCKKLGKEPKYGQ